MKITLFGVRGSFPVPGKETFRYGGNTSSLCIEFNDKDFVIIDAGTGIRNLGNYLIKKENGLSDINILFTHTHWDHIMGIPFFAPIYSGGAKIHMFGPSSNDEQSLKDIILSQLEHKYFPVSAHELTAEVTQNQLSETSFELLGAKISTIRLNHPCVTLGYRIEYKDNTLVTVFDHEPYHHTIFLDDGTAQILEGNSPLSSFKKLNDRLMNFIEGADIAIMDSQYTKSEYFNGKQGYGHSYYEYTLWLAKEAKIKKVILFHHDPVRTDAQLDVIAKSIENNIVENSYQFTALLAKEGMEIIV